MEDILNASDLTSEEISLKIQQDRIMYIIGRCLSKLNTVAFLPHLLQNDGEILKRYLKRAEIFFILELLSNWGLNFDSSGISTKEFIGDYLRIGTVNQTTKKQISSGHSEDFESIQLFQMMDILFYNKCIQAVIRNAKNPKLNKNVLGLRKAFYDLKEVAKTTVYITGEHEKLHQKKLRKAFKINIRLEGIVEELKQQLEKQRSELAQQLNDKVQIVEMYVKKKESVLENSQLDMRRAIHDSENEMMQVCIDSETKQANLAEKAEEIVKTYDTITKNDLAEEQKERGGRLKVTAQLGSWINTYDQDIGDKQVEYEEFLDEFNNILAQKTRLEELLNNQEDLYNTSMREKAEEEERLFNEMAYQFFLGRCAKKIQKYWSLYTAQRASKKKKR